MQDLLNIRNLQTSFFLDEGVLHAVDDLDLVLQSRQTFGLVGESGCGKSVTSLSVLRLIPDPPGRITGGEIWFKGRNLLTLPEPEMRRIRGKEISMIFQEPMTSLNPVFTVGDQIAESLILHEKMSRKAAFNQAAELLDSVSIPDPHKRIREYPHQMSGGMRQRVMIAMAISCNPALLIADEPTTALDVTIQAQILDLLARLKSDMNLSMLLITHDLGVIAEVADRVAVMYAGKIVEQAPVIELFRQPMHPYSQGLMRSVPRLDKSVSASGKLETIEGTVPSLAELPPGCAFAPRCPHARADCADSSRMTFTYPEPDHAVRCILYQE